MKKMWRRLHLTDDDLGASHPSQGRAELPILLQLVGERAALGGRERRGSNSSSALPSASRGRERRRS
jgi:hypothetical protein